MRCARHPNVETALSCGRCGKAICPDCMVSAPVGFRCRDCASLNSSPLYQVRPERFVLATLAGLAAGTVAGILYQMAFIYLLIVAPAVGGLVGEAVLRATGRKRGTRLEILAGASVVAGAALSLLVTGRFYVLFSPFSAVIFLAAVALTASAAVAKIRYW